MRKYVTQSFESKTVNGHDCQAALVKGVFLFIGAVFCFLYVSPIWQQFVLYKGYIAMKKLLCVLAALTVAAVLCGCNNIDPSLKPDSSGAPVSYTDTKSAQSEQPIPAHIDADALAHRSYELRYLLAQERFNTPDEISVNALVQYSFCHLFYENLTDMPRTGNKLRQASVEEIKQEIENTFGPVTADITQADLYNAGRQCFEMWEPLYGTEIFYDVSVSRADTDTYQARTVFYSDAAKTEVMGKTVLTVQDNGGQILIQKMTSSK